MNSAGTVLPRKQTVSAQRKLSELFFDLCGVRAVYAEHLSTLQSNNKQKLERMQRSRHIYTDILGFN